MSTLKVLGIMSGTSLDGVDYVKIKIHKKNLRCEFISIESFPYPKNLKEKILKAAQNELLTAELAKLNHELGKFYAEGFSKLSSAMKSVDLIGLHGQTVFHQGRIATLQIGEPSYLSLASQKKVISNFRAADIAAGGEGAPLAPFFHQVVFGKKNKTISLHNLGGISNLSLIQNKKLILGFDTGPANMLIDEEIRLSTGAKKLFDKNGQWAAKGQLDLKLLGEMLKHNYFNKPVPKSCGREEFGKDFYKAFKIQLQKLSIEDRLRTLTELTVQSIVKSYVQFCKPMPSEIIFCGGGSKNNFLIQRLSQELEGVLVSTVEDYNWPTQSIEAAAFALLAACCHWRIPANVSQATQASKKVILGQITQV